MKKSILLTVVCVMLVCIFLAGCTAGGEQPAPSEGAEAPESATQDQPVEEAEPSDQPAKEEPADEQEAVTADGEPIKVGCIQDTSGATSAQGLSVQRGVELAVDTINAQGGLDGHPIELYSYDCEADPQEAINAYQRLASVDGVSVVLGPPLSNIGLACVEVTDQTQVPFLGAFAMNSCMVNPDTGDVNQYMFAVQPTAEYSGQTLADYVMNKLGLQNFGVLARQDQAYLVASCEQFVKTVEANGGTITNRQNVTKNDMDYKVQINNIVASSPDMLVVFLETNDTVIFLNQAQQLGIDLPIGATNSAADPMVSMLDDPPSANNIYFTNNLDIEEPSLQDIHSAYVEKFGSEPDIKSYVGYDLVTTLAEAITQAGYAYDSVSIRDSLETNIKDLEICQGTLTLSAEHMPVGLSMVMYQIENGEYIYLERYAPAD